MIKRRSMLSFFGRRLLVFYRHSTQCLARSKYSCVDVDVGGRPMRLETGRFARMADGCVLGRMGDTVVMVTVVGKEKSSAHNFMPLTVDYRNRASAFGRIPTNFLRREIGVTDAEILTGRLIDRSLRCCFSKECYSDCQVLCNLISYDGINDPEVLSVNAASAALACSPILWQGPVAAVRVALDANGPLVNPTKQQLEKSRFNLVLTSTADRRVVMVEASGDGIPTDVVRHCAQCALDSSKGILEAIGNLQTSAGKQKRSSNPGCQPGENLINTVRQYAESPLVDILNDHSLDKVAVDERIAALRQETSLHVKEILAEDEVAQFDESFTDLIRLTLRKQIFKTGVRRDGRTVDGLRPIDCQVDLYKPLHGSAVFQRGQTQVLCTVTFDSHQAAFKGDVVSLLGGSAKEKRFMLHYTFSPFATNEISTSRGINRRELGHGALAEKALRAVVPREFPFTIRLASDVLESNGSSSMATVCAGSMALMDSGVPIRCPVSGVAIGLVTMGEDYRLLVDIAGIEDYFGDMDFKIASSKEGVTAMQLDTKLLGGIADSIFMEAIEAGVEANDRILTIMSSCIAAPRSGLKPNGPVEETLEVAPSKRARFLGPGGMHLKRVEANTNVQITQIDDARYSVFAPNRRSMEEAKKELDILLEDNYEDKFEFGSICTAKITELRDNGVMVILHPQMQPVLLPNSQLDMRRVGHPSNLGLEVGQEICVKYFGRDPVTGHMRLSRKVLQQAEPATRHDLFASKNRGSNPWISSQGNAGD
ncbi:polyribonucleotide nucleotidyltransferase 1 [Trichuris trichiura]|uniref:polyribonucleotide nucleotidyltransferase n=1 Tax=Trichuris trichiura TaxID=36087 RepID=A0A077YYZ3_TRITR|nr:polyribonucleotide nucleotidyltransferase 1 [Trichuris trichiura]